MIIIRKYDDNGNIYGAKWYYREIPEKDLKEIFALLSKDNCHDCRKEFYKSDMIRRCENEYYCKECFEKLLEKNPYLKRMYENKNRSK